MSQTCSMSHIERLLGIWAFQECCSWKISPFFSGWLVCPLYCLSYGHVKSLMSPNGGGGGNSLLPNPSLASTLFFCSLSHQMSWTSCLYVLFLLPHLILLLYHNYSYQSTNDLFVASFFSASQQYLIQSTTCFFLKFTILWAFMTVPSGFFPSQLLLLSSPLFSVCIGLLGHSSEPHLFFLCSLTWYFICFQNFMVQTPQFISPVLILPLNIGFICSMVYLTYPLGCLIIIVNLTYPKQNLDF